ncbi:MAG: FAD-binding oxidoreductase [Rubrivivax sp.]|nr:FAD-binding oxidoreductase [Rubrivivax sp.]
MSRPDVLVIGGAVIGSAAAHFLCEMARPPQVLVLERDPTYTGCATTRSLASIRHQFSTPLNVAISMFGTAFIREAAQRLEVPGTPAVDLVFREAGYLFLASAAGREQLEANHAVQRACGADVALLDPEALRQRFPWLHVDDLAAGSLGLRGEGWIDAHALMHGLRRRAAWRGARWQHAEAVSLEREGSRVVAVRLADGTRLSPGLVILAAGTRAAALAATAGIDLPVRARRRCVFRFRSPERAPGCPLVIDPSGVYVRPEGDGYLCGVAPGEHEDPDVAPDDFEVDHALWEERLWPVLAQRVPGFEAARVGSSWAGHYDVNVLDHNAIVGLHPDVDNLLFANGYSGHGVQQAPAVGRALAEWVEHGGWRTLDFRPLGWSRVLRGEPLREVNVV